VSQGNPARASQMRWQVRRYTALMESFHREADAKLLEASGVRPRQNAENPAPQRQKPRPSANTERQSPTVVNIDFGPQARRKRSSGTLKPALRVQGREVRDPGPSNPQKITHRV